MNEWLPSRKSLEQTHKMHKFCETMLHSHPCKGRPQQATGCANICAYWHFLVLGAPQRPFGPSIETQSTHPSCHYRWKWERKGSTGMRKARSLLEGPARRLPAFHAPEDPSALTIICRCICIIPARMLEIDGVHWFGFRQGRTLPNLQRFSNSMQMIESFTNNGGRHPLKQLSLDWQPSYNHNYYPGDDHQHLRHDYLYYYCYYYYWCYYNLYIQYSPK